MVVDHLRNTWAPANSVFGARMIEMLPGEPERAARTTDGLFEQMGARNQGSTAAALRRRSAERQLSVVCGSARLPLERRLSRKDAMS